MGRGTSISGRNAKARLCGFQVYEEVEMMQKWEDENLDTEQARTEMGKWLADYLDDAGYQNWATYPAIYKTMFMNAFPPIDPLDDKKMDVDSVGVEDVLLKFMKIADLHIAS